MLTGKAISQRNQLFQLLTSVEIHLYFQIVSVGVVEVNVIVRLFGD